MPGTSRQFEPQITRSGGVPSKYRFTVRCSKCPNSDSYETRQSVSDEIIKGCFKERGWLLGRDRAYDLCPACLARPRDAERRRVNEIRHQTVAMTARPSDHETAPISSRRKDTAEILARHLGKSEALAAEVFRPKPPQPPHLSAPDTAQQPASTPVLSPEVEKALTGMAADLKSLRSTMELMAEQMSKLVTLAGQQIEAIARLAPLVVQSSDRLSGGLQDIVSTIKLNSRPADISLSHQPSPAPEPSTEQDQDICSGPEAEQVVMPTGPAKKSRRPRTNGSIDRSPSSGHVAVKSIADAKRPDRFYTTIRLPRELWDRSGFGPEDRLQLDWKKKTLSITRVLDGGVKPKTVGDAVVVLQSWCLGDLNFDPTKFKSGTGLLRLTSP